MEFSNKKTNKITFLTIVGIFILGISNAQINTNTQQRDFWENVRFGGGIGFSVRGNDFSGTLAPSVLYDVNKTLSLGLSLNGSIYNRKNYFKSTILGGSLLGFVHPVRQVQLSTEFERLHVNRKYEGAAIQEDRKYWYSALFLGAGYRTGNVTFGMRYDVLYDRNESIYSEAWMPFIRFYF